MSEASNTLGARLRAERERKGLSAQKAADEMHLDGWVVEALESGDYSRVGPPVYVKGHLKRYAGVLGLAEADILEGLEIQPVAPPPPSAAAVTLRMRTSTPTGGNLPWIPLAGVALVALLAAGLWWWKPWRPRPPDVPPMVAAGAQPANASVAPSGAAGPDGTLAQTGAVGQGSGAAGGEVAVSAASDTAARSTAPVAPGSGPGASVPGAGRARLRLSFSADSWVDVHDAAGQRLYAGNGHANSVKTIVGDAPLHVYLKAASGVQLEVNNHVVAIGRQYMLGEVARFEAGADGVLRRDSAVRPHG